MSLKPSRIPTIKGRPLASALADVGFSLGAAAASGAKKSRASNHAEPGAAKAKKRASKASAGLQASGPVSTTPVSVPSSIGFMTNSTNAGHRHTPFRIAGSCIMANLAASASGAPLIYNTAGSLTTTLKFSLDVTGSGGSADNFA